MRSRGEGVHDAIMLGAVLPQTQGAHILVDPDEVRLASQRPQACLHQVLFAGRKLNSTAPAHELGHEGEGVC